MAQSLSTFFKRSKKWQTSRTTGHLFFLFFLQFSFFLWIEFGFFHFFFLAFVFFSFVTHIGFSLFLSGFPEWLLPAPLSASPDVFAIGLPADARRHRGGQPNHGKVSFVAPHE